jgi:hypothetical protein
MLNGKRNGTFVEIGASHPTWINNTYLLENSFGWNGISIDMDSGMKNAWENMNRVLLLENALTLDYTQLFERNHLPTQIDYLQIDIDPCTQTFTCLKRIPFDKYRFSVITYETDYYDTNTPNDIKNTIRKESRELLTSHGYELVVGDVENVGNDPFEDWYVDPNIIDRKTINKLKTEHLSLIPDKFMLD